MPVNTTPSACSIEYEEINRQISRLEYHDPTERILEIVAKIPENTAFEWHSVCGYWEMKRGLEEFREDYTKMIREELHLFDDVDEKDARLQEIEKELYGQIVHLESDRKDRVLSYAVAAKGIRLLNEAGKVAVVEDFGRTFDTMPDRWALAKELETWLYYYKEIYRSVSRESELRRIEDLVCWYGDFLREEAKQ